VALPKHFLKSWNCLLKSDTCVAALKRLKKDPEAPAFTDSPPWRFTHPFAVISRLSFITAVSGAAVAFVAVAAVVDVLVTATALVEVGLETFVMDPLSAVPLVATEVELDADTPVAAAAAVVLLLVLTTVALPPALTVRSSVADASRFKKTVA